MTAYPPIPSEMGTFLAQLGAVDIVDRYRDGTLPDGMRRFVDMTIRQCELQGADAQKWADGVVAMTVRDWAAALADGDADEEARSMMVASSTLAAFLLQSGMPARV